MINNTIYFSVHYEKRVFYAYRTHFFGRKERSQVTEALLKVSVWASTCYQGIVKFPYDPSRFGSSVEIK
jgi:hypothetical protein